MVGGWEQMLCNHCLFFKEMTLDKMVWNFWHQFRTSFQCSFRWYHSFCSLNHNRIRIAFDIEDFMKSGWVKKWNNFSSSGMIFDFVEEWLIWIFLWHPILETLSERLGGKKIFEFFYDLRCCGRVAERKNGKIWLSRLTIALEGYKLIKGLQGCADKNYHESDRIFKILSK